RMREVQTRHQISRHEETPEEIMLNKVAIIAFAVLIPIVAFGTPKEKKEKETIEVKVVSSKVRNHGAFPRVFSYTYLMDTEVDGKKVEFACAQRGDECPMMES